MFEEIIEEMQDLETLRILTKIPIPKINSLKLHQTNTIKILNRKDLNFLQKLKKCQN